ncbi:MAG: MFS transporter, partial [Flavobacterium sp.]
SEMLAASASQASFNIGNALGAFFGGLPLVYGFDYTSPAYVGAAMALIGAFFAIWLIRSTTTKGVPVAKEKYVVMH